jgi:hypothetical protein
MSCDPRDLKPWPLDLDLRACVAYGSDVWRSNPDSRLAICDDFEGLSSFVG